MLGVWLKIAKRPTARRIYLLDLICTMPAQLAIENVVGYEEVKAPDTLTFERAQAIDFTRRTGIFVVLHLGRVVVFIRGSNY